jgi:hypothetical protein
MIYCIKLDRAQVWSTETTAIANIVTFLTRCIALAKKITVTKEQGYVGAAAVVFTVITIETSAAVAIPGSIPTNASIENTVYNSETSLEAVAIDKAEVKRGDYLGMLAAGDITDELDGYIKIANMSSTYTYYFGVANTNESESYTPKRTAISVCRINANAARRIVNEHIQKRIKNIKGLNIAARYNAPSSI